MRVIAGQFGGRRLRAPSGTTTRPTADRVREALFSMLGDIGGMRVLDLWAGSGALGIEAISRGAASAEFVDRDRHALEALRTNLSELGIEDAAVHGGDALRHLVSAAGRGSSFDLVFCDPPYDGAPRLGGPLSERLAPVLSERAVIVTESDKRAPLELALPLVRERTYGDTRIAIHHAR